MKILFLGEDNFSAIVLDSLVHAGHEIVQVFTPMYNNEIHAKLAKYCTARQIPFERLTGFNTPEFVQRVKDLAPELIVVCHFQKLIKQEVIDLPTYGCINLHPSLLPDYRGMAPQHWPIINGEQQTAVTVHFIDDGVDTGDIIEQDVISIGPDEYVFDLQRRMMEIYKNIVVRAVNRIAAGEQNWRKQRHLPGSYFGRLKASQCIIDPADGVQRAYNLIKGVSYPYLGARFKGKQIWRASIATANQEQLLRQAGAAEGWHVTGDQAYLVFHDGVLVIEKHNDLV